MRSQPRTTCVLGAGASLHAGYPLAHALGAALSDWVEQTRPAGCGGYRKSIARLRELYGNLDNFESIMTDLLQIRPPADRLTETERPIVIQRIEEAIRECFNEIRHRPAPLYDSLARHRIRSGDTVITFNYDLGIERSLRSAGRWEINDGYGFQITNDSPSSAVRVLKLHGSTNWRGLINGGTTAFQIRRNSLGSRPVLLFPPDLEYLQYPEFEDPLRRNVGSAASLSALILPSLNKTFYHETSFGREWEPFWDGLWRQAEESLSNAEAIVVIGYSLPDADERARALLLDSRNKNAALTICCGRRSAHMEEQFRERGFTNISCVLAFEE